MWLATWWHKNLSLLLSESWFIIITYSRCIIHWKSPPLVCFSFVVHCYYGVQNDGFYWLGSLLLHSPSCIQHRLLCSFCYNPTRDTSKWSMSFCSSLSEWQPSLHFLSVTLTFITKLCYVCKRRGPFIIRGRECVAEFVLIHLIWK